MKKLLQRSFRFGLCSCLRNDYVYKFLPATICNRNVEVQLSKEKFKSNVIVFLGEIIFINFKINKKNLFIFIDYKNQV